MSMRGHKRNAYNRIQIVAFISVCLLVSVAPGLGNTQGGEPITKENLIAALKDCKDRRHCSRCRRCKLKASDFIQQIKQLKVDFVVYGSAAREIREAGDFFSKKELDELIAAIRNAYVFYVPAPNDEAPLNPTSLDEISRTMNITLFDSYSDDIVDGKVRLIHSSVTNSLSLNTSYKFYESNAGISANLFGSAYGEKNHPDGTLLIGKEFIKHLLISDAKSSLTNDSRLYFSIAHVMSHFKQTKSGGTPAFTEIQRELHANFLAGWCVARFLKTTKSDSPEYREAFFNVMDIAFHYGYPPERYGTPKSRLDAASAGFGLQTETDPDKVYRKGIEYVGRL